MTYIGDGVYVEVLGCMIHMATSDGYEIKDEIYIEVQVWRELKRFAQSVGFEPREEVNE